MARRLTRGYAVAITNHLDDLSQVSFISSAADLSATRKADGILLCGERSDHMRTVLLVSVAIAAAFPLLSADVKGTPDDEAAIRNVIKQWDAAWNRHDAKALLAQNTENADAVNRHGRYESSADLEKHVAQMFKGTFSDTQSAPQKIFVVRFIRPDVAIVRTVWETPDLMINGRKVPREDMIVSYVMTKDAGKWSIAGQDNHVVSAGVSGVPIALPPIPKQ